MIKEFLHWLFTGKVVCQNCECDKINYTESDTFRIGNILERTVHVRYVCKHCKYKITVSKKVVGKTIKSLDTQIATIFKEMDDTKFFS